MNAKPPLSGYTVLELGSTVAGPFCGRLLADFGAEVIKVEPPEGDPVRAMGSHVDGKSLYAASILRNKKLISLDLRQPEARRIVARLAERVDVLVENFRPGTLEKWGLGPDALHERNPGLVVVRISGFGQSGPYRDRPGYGFLGDAVGGMLHINGYPDRAPVRAAVPVTDMTTGIYAAFGAVMALLARQSSGRGQVVDAALYETAFSLMESHVAPYELLGRIAMRAGSRLPGSTPNNLYPTLDGHYIAMAAASDSVFRRLATVMGQEALASDERFATGLARVTHQDALDAILAEWTRGFRLAELERLLQDNDVPASRIFTMADVFEDPHYAARGTIVRPSGGELQGPVAMPVPVPRLSGTPGEVRHSGGCLGQDTEEVLREKLGLSESELAALKESRAIHVGAK
ncbi:MAG TPA: CaiB/BaiF CoA-transferase family protein [Ramlibacter sp.]|uniref:CaiB/BaiF CoA transferase family protein n=1 Tax=Ramlibacter sp. TaxID=1917967 RepID=UPI002CB504B6|nr:CaiB/BaiF CoA-transferase family protein [Ramlibacter sp.]HVZ42346.1 CaiB/BaiF CoA-transferase family protein [Ramlibacter sp.]